MRKIPTPSSIGLTKTTCEDIYHDIHLKQAEELLDREGKKELTRHAEVGRICRCGNCFCCACAEVYKHA